MQNAWFRKSRFKGGKGKKLNIGGGGLGYRERPGLGSENTVSSYYSSALRVGPESWVMLGLFSIWDNLPEFWTLSRRELLFNLLAWVNIKKHLRVLGWLGVLRRSVYISTGSQIVVPGLAANANWYPTLDLVNQKLWWWGPAVYFYKPSSSGLVPAARRTLLQSQSAN